MKIVIAPDSFKENLTSLQVGKAIEKGIRRVLPKARVEIVPMADGGEGTVQSLVDATGGKIVRKKVTGPMGTSISARYGMLGDGATAVIEMAEASGLPLVPREERDPLQATTFGTGELLLDAIKRGAKSIIIGLGGSATVDGGIGMAQALGVRFLDQRGKAIAPHAGGGALEKVAAIDVSQVAPGLRKTRVIVACDVDNPLCGRKGAAHVFGPQKGASPALVKKLDAGLKNFGAVIRKDLKKDVLKLAGAGAAGGLGAGLVAFTGARLKSGVDIVIEATGLAAHLKGADLVITGEGRVDFQTAFGKTPAGVAKTAHKQKIPVVAIGGGLADDARGVFEHGIDALDAAAARDMSLEEAIRLSREHLANAGERVIRMIQIGQRMERQKARRVAARKQRTLQK